jgi:hypothetical protein
MFFIRNFRITCKVDITVIGKLTLTKAGNESIPRRNRTYHVMKKETLNVQQSLSSESIEDRVRPRIELKRVIKLRTMHCAP